MRDAVASPGLNDEGAHDEAASPEGHARLSRAASSVACFGHSLHDAMRGPDAALDAHRL